MKKMILFLITVLSLNVLCPEINAVLVIPHESIVQEESVLGQQPTLDQDKRQAQKPIVKKRKIINHQRNLLSTWDAEDGSKVVIDWDQVSRMGSFFFWLGDRRWITKVIANFIMLRKELQRGETARALEHSPLYSFASIYLLINNKQKDRMSKYRQGRAGGYIMALLATVLVTSNLRGQRDQDNWKNLIDFACCIAGTFYDGLSLISDLTKGMWPVGYYSKEEFDAIYGKEYKIMQKVIAPR